MALAQLLSLLVTLNASPRTQSPEGGELVIALRWASDAGTVLELDHRRIERADLAAKLSPSRAEEAHARVMIEATTAVPWNDVLSVLRTCQERGAAVELRMAEVAFANELRAAKLSTDRIVRVVEPRAAASDAAIVMRVAHAPADACACPAHLDKRACGELGHWRVEIESSASRTPADRNPLRSALSTEANKKRDDANPLLSGRTVHIAADAFAPFGFVRWILEQSAAVGIYHFELADGSGAALAYRLPIATGMLGR